MEVVKMERPVAEESFQVNEPVIQELLDIQLALVGGGIGEVIVG